MHVVLTVWKQEIKGMELMAIVRAAPEGQMTVEEITPVDQDTMECLQDIRERNPTDDLRFLKKVESNYVRSSLMQAKFVG